MTVRPPRPPLNARPLRLAFAMCLLAAPATAARAQERPRPGTLPGTGSSLPPITRRPPRAPKAPATAPASRATDSTVTVPLVGTVYDSLSAAPLAGATVQLVSERDRSVTLTTTTDSAGTYRIPAVRPGRYLAGFFHPSLDALGVEMPPVLVDVQGAGDARLEFAVPGARRLLPALCGANAPAGRNPAANQQLTELLQPPAKPGALVGMVRDADSGEPLANARVVVTWNEVQVSDDGVRTARRRAPVRARPDGGFTACGLPSGTDLVVDAEAPGRRSGLVELRLQPGELSRRDFALGDSATAIAVTVPDSTAAQEGRLAVPITVARGNARLSGVVRYPDGRPMGNAKLVVIGTGVSGATSPTGAFTLTGLPAGTYTLEVRAIGYSPKRVAVNLSSRRPTSVAVALDEKVQAVESVIVRGDRGKLQKDFTGFLDRSKRGLGRYITEDQIAQRNAFVMTDVLRMTPGLTVVPNGAMGYSLRGRGGQCTPDLYVDGMRVMDGAADIDQLVRPGDAAGVEIYNGAGSVPAQFSGGSASCGVVAVWTKRGK